jgi:hypothetical protein
MYIPSFSVKTQLIH